MNFFRFVCECLVQKLLKASKLCKQIQDVIHVMNKCSSLLGINFIKSILNTGNYRHVVLSSLNDSLCSN